MAVLKSQKNKSKKLLLKKNVFLNSLPNFLYISNIKRGASSTSRLNARLKAKSKVFLVAHLVFL